MLTARRCVPPVTSLRCQGPTRSEVQSTHLLHQCVHALLLHFKGTKPISVESATDKSNRKHHHTSKLAPSVSPERQLASGRATSLSLACVRLSLPSSSCLIDSPSIPKNWTRESGSATRPTRMTRSILRQEGSACHNRIHSNPTRTTAALEFVVAVTYTIVSNAPRQSSLSVRLRATIAHLRSACRMAQWMIRGRNTHRTLKHICAHSACRPQRAKFNNNGNNLSNQPGQKRRQRSLVQALLDNNDSSQCGHHGERVMRCVAFMTNFVVHMRVAQRSKSTNSA